MPVVQAQLVKWSLPAFAIILGLLWYKRRRVDRVDPGGLAKRQQTQTADQGKGSPAKVNGTAYLCDSGIHTEESFILNASASTPKETAAVEISPKRKVSESMDIPNRKSSCSQSTMLSCQSMEFINAPWYEDVDNTPETNEIQLGSNPGKNGFDLLAKSKSSNGLNKSIGLVEDIIKEEPECKVIIANNDCNSVNKQQSPLKHQKSPQKQQISPQKQQTSPQKQQIKHSEIQHDKQKQQKNEKETSSKSNKTESMDDQTEVKQEKIDDNNKQETQGLSERDSANHSPVSGVLEGSVTDEASSEGSNDSGKGGSIKDARESQKEDRLLYEFLVPLKLVGKLIGRNGRFLQHLRNNADVHIMIKRHPSDREFKICSIEGTSEGITNALEIIRQHFPEKNYPNFSLESYTYDDITDELPFVPELAQLSLVEGVNNDVIISQIIGPNHFFVQLPTHPTYPALKILDQNLTTAYNSVESPPVPDELKEGMIVVAKWYDKWVRVYIETPDPKGEQTVARLVDHGGYWSFKHADMRKIRFDFLSLPFQAIEVFLANVQPKNGEWSKEAFEVVRQICSGIVGQAQIVGYMDYNIYINLYFSFHKHGVISLADELIARGLAEPIPLVEQVVAEEVQHTE